MKRRKKRRKSLSSSPSRWSIDVPSILLAIVVLTSPLAIGGVHATTAAALAALALAGLWWSIASSMGDKPQTSSFVLSIPALACGAMALLCLIQLIPVPTSVYRLIQPAGYEAWMANGEVLFGSAPSSGWHLLSLDPGRTTDHALRWTALAATAALAAQVIDRRSSRRRWLGLLVICGTLAAIAGAAQYLSGTEKMLGFYEAQISARSIAPFVNTNHAAGFYGMMAIIAIAFSVDHLRRSPLKTTFGAIAATAGIILCAAHGSDGALLALVISIGIVTITILTRAAPTDDRHKRRRFITLTTLGLFFAAAIALFAIPDEWTVSDEEYGILDETSAEIRLHMAHAAIDAATDHPFVGSGAGSVERALPPYLDWHYVGPRTVPTVENEPAEWAMTLGPLAVVIALLAFAIAVFRTAPHVGKRRGRNGPAYAFALTAFFSTIALFHFPFAAMGLAIPFLVALEACLSQKRDGFHRFASRRRLALFALALTLALAGTMMARHYVLVPGAEDHLDVSDSAEVERAVHLYPTDGVLMSAISLHARADGDDEQALKKAQRAFELRPHPQQEFLVATSLANLGRHQEAAETYRSLLDNERNRSHNLYGWAEPRLRHDLPTAEVRAIALEDAALRTWRRFFRHLREEEGTFSAIGVALELVDLRPDDARAHMELIDLYRQAEQEELAEMYARTLVGRNLEDEEGRSPAGLLTLIDIVGKQGRRAEVFNIAHRAFAAGHSLDELGREVLRFIPANIEEIHQEHHQVIQTAVDVGCHPPYEESYRHLCWRGHAFLAEIEGQPERAETYLRRIANLHDDPRRLATFYVRHERCRDLATVLRQHRDGRHERFLERQARECARQWERPALD